MITALVPGHLVDRKPPHGSPCTRCGVCCIASLCETGAKVFDQRKGPCPALKWDPGEQSYCDLARNPTGYLLGDKDRLSVAMKLLIGNGAGCDMVFHGEPRNFEHDLKWYAATVLYAKEFAWARKLLWGEE